MESKTSNQVIQLYPPLPFMWIHSAHSIPRFFNRDITPATSWCFSWVRCFFLGSLEQLQQLPRCWLSLALELPIANLADVLSFLRRHRGSRSSQAAEALQNSSFQAVQSFLRSFQLELKEEDVKVLSWSQLGQDRQIEVDWNGWKLGTGLVDGSDLVARSKQTICNTIFFMVLVCSCWHYSPSFSICGCLKTWNVILSHSFSSISTLELLGFPLRQTNIILLAVSHHSPNNLLYLHKMAGISTRSCGARRMQILQNRWIEFRRPWIHWKRHSWTWSGRAPLRIQDLLIFSFDFVTFCIDESTIGSSGIE